MLTKLVDISQFRCDALALSLPLPLILNNLAWDIPSYLQTIEHIMVERDW